MDKSCYENLLNSIKSKETPNKLKKNHQMNKYRQCAHFKAHSTGEKERRSFYFVSSSRSFTIPYLLSFHRFFQMRYFLLEIFPWLLGMKVPKRENNKKTIKESWRQRRKQSETKTVFDYVRKYIILF